MKSVKECWDVAYALNSVEVWQRLATAAMETLDIELALRIYRQQGDVSLRLCLRCQLRQTLRAKPPLPPLIHNGFWDAPATIWTCPGISLRGLLLLVLPQAAMVLGLEKVLQIEDSKLMAGHVAMLFGEYATAQVRFHA